MRAFKTVPSLLLPREGREDWAIISAPAPIF